MWQNHSNEHNRWSNDANDQKFKKEQLDLKSNGDFGYVFQT